MKRRRAPAILITGSPGSGKSTLIARLIDGIGTRQIAGLSTPEVRRRNVRVGFKMIDLATREEEMLASTSGKGPVIGKYHVDVQAIDRMVGKVESSLAFARIIFIDEIGRMELFSSRFKEFADRVFSLDKPVIAVVHRSLVREYQNKGRLFTLTRNNFDDVQMAILAELK
jgi:nucleoside-triphosphatase